MTARKSVYAIPLTHGCRMDIDRLTRCGMVEVDENMADQNDTNDESLTEAHNCIDNSSDAKFVCWGFACIRQSLDIQAELSGVLCH